MKDIHLDAEGACRMLEGLNPAEIHILDFKDVVSVDFAALRKMLSARQDGLKISIVNVCDAVADKFEDAGITSFISICRGPVPVDMEHYTRSGESPNSIAYYCDDGDHMLKLYTKLVTGPYQVEREKMSATSVMQMGIPSPLAGPLAITADGRKGLIFERIKDKKSFSRAIADDPDNYAGYAKRFAGMAKRLHHTECNTALFESRAEDYARCIRSCIAYDDAEKKRLLDFLDTVPSATTCLHGDFHPGNMVTTGGEDIWIDLGDFGYGNPWFDFGQFYMISHLQSEEMTLENHHFSKALMLEFWDAVIRDYFNVDDDISIREIEIKAASMAALALIKYAFVSLPAERYPILKGLIDKFLSDKGWKF